MALSKRDLSSEILISGMLENKLSNKLKKKLTQGSVSKCGGGVRSELLLHHPHFIHKNYCLSFPCSLYDLLIFWIFTLSNAKHGESIVIGLAASSTSKGPPVKTTEPTVKIKVTNCSIQLG